VHLELFIDGMLSVHSKHAVFSALAGVSGLSAVQIELGRVELESERPEAEFTALEAELRDAIAAAGLSVSAIKRLPRRLPLV
jgi:hypothetical protein